MKIMTRPNYIVTGQGKIFESKFKSINLVQSIVNILYRTCYILHILVIMLHLAKNSTIYVLDADAEGKRKLARTWRR